MNFGIFLSVVLKRAIGSFIHLVNFVLPLGDARELFLVHLISGCKTEKKPFSHNRSASKNLFTWLYMQGLEDYIF